MVKEWWLTPFPLRRTTEENRKGVNKEFYNQYVGELFHSAEALEILFREASSLSEASTSRDSVHVHKSFEEVLLVLGRNLESMLNFFHYTLGEDFPEAEKILDDMRATFDNLEIMKTGSKADVGQTVDDIILVDQTKLKDAHQLLNKFRIWIDETISLLPRINEKTERYLQSDKQYFFEKDVTPENFLALSRNSRLKNPKVTGSYKKYFYL